MPSPTTEIPLPDSAQALIGLIGLSATIELVRAFGGVKLYTPRNYARQQALFADVIGDRLAEIVCQAHVDQGPWNIPRCLGPLRAVRDQAIRADYDTGQFTINALVWKYRLGHSRIEQILKRPTCADVCTLTGAARTGPGE